MGKELEVLKAVDVARTQRYHFTVLTICGMGFLTITYNLFCIGLVTKLLGRLYYTDLNSDSPGILPINVAFAVNLTSMCGTLAGQLFFGWLGDKIGRKKVYGITLILIIVTSICSAIPMIGFSSTRVMISLCFFRFWVGFGAGGDYPLTATIMSEYANKKTRGSFIAAVYAMQGFGVLMSGAVALAVSAVFEYKYHAPAYYVNKVGSLPETCDYIWRIVLMFGALPAALTYYLRMKMPETARYTALVGNDAVQAVADMSSVLNVNNIEAEVDMLNEIVTDPRNQFGLWSKEFVGCYGRRLLGTTVTWFLIEVVMSSENLVQRDLFTAVGWIPPAKEMSGIQEVYKVAKAVSLIAFCGIVPGLSFTVIFIDVVGRMRIQKMGFFFLMGLMIVMASYWDHLMMEDNQAGFIVLYSITYFFAYFGPKTTTFVVAAEIFPARLRSTCHGILAAAASVGAIVGVVGMWYLLEEENGIGKRKTLFLLAGINFFGMLFSGLVPESNGKSLEELSGEVEYGDAENNA